MRESREKLHVSMTFDLRFAQGRRLAGLAVVITCVLQHSDAGAAPAVTAVAAGSGHSLFIRSDGSLWGMGANFDGELGLGSNVITTNQPTLIVSNGVGGVAAGLAHTLFRMGTSLWVMGGNDDGQLGDGSTTYHYVPEKIFTGSGGTSISLIGTGSGAVHSLFATSGLIGGSTALRGMGNNPNGELGDGTYTNHLMPETIQTGGMLSAAMGQEHSLFVKSDGSLWAMGDDEEDQLGVFFGFQQNTNRPVEVVSNNVTTVAAGYFHSLFIKSDGSLWAAGLNDSGQLGDNSTGEAPFPVEIVTNGVTTIAAGAEHSVFIRSDRCLWGMGDNTYGQLGGGFAVGYHVPTPIASNVVAVAAGDYYTLFVKTDGSLWGMGKDNFGQLGDGGSSNRLTTFEILAGPQPVITGVSVSGTNLNLTGFNGVSGETLVTLMSSNVTQALIQWQPVATNLLNVTGNWTITATNAVDPASSAHRFYILKAQ